MLKLIKWDNIKNDWVYLSVENALNAEKLGNKDTTFYAANKDLQNIDSNNTQQHNEMFNSINTIDSDIKKLQKDSLAPVYGNYKIAHNAVNDTLEILYIGEE